MTADCAPFRVVVADDDADIRRLLAKRLSVRGFDVMAVADGSEAVELSRTCSPAALVLDSVALAESGATVCEEMRRDSRTASIPIVVLSGWVDEDRRRRAFEAGVDEYLTKPFEIGTVEDALHRVIVGKQPSLTPHPGDSTC